MNIFIVGSAPKFEIPKDKIDLVVTGNGAAERAYQIEDLKKIKRYAITTHGEFIKNMQVRNKVLNSNSDKIISRCGDISSYLNFKIDNLNYELISQKKQLKIQSTVLENSFLDLFFSELKYEENIINKLKHIKKLTYHFLGASTGLFAAIYCLTKYPNANIFISGLSFYGGPRYYKVGKITTKGDVLADDSMRLGRGRVDSYILSKIKAKFKNRIKIIT